METQLKLAASEEGPWTKEILSFFPFTGELRKSLESSAPVMSPMSGESIRGKGEGMSSSWIQDPIFILMFHVLKY